MKKHVLLFFIIATIISATCTACSSTKPSNSQAASAASQSLTVTDIMSAPDINNIGESQAGEISSNQTSATEPSTDVPQTSEAFNVMSSWGFDITEVYASRDTQYIEPNFMILVNKSNPLSEDTYIGEMVAVSQNYNGELQQYTEDQVMLELTTAKAMCAMLNEANKLFPDTTVFPDSGYRSIAYQQEIFERYVRLEGEAAARRRVSTPGTSEHHTGLACDIAMWKNGVYIDDVDDKEPVIAWIHEHAHEYGFILRYPNGYSFKYEPWHFRYVGVENATKIKESGQLFEDYCASL